MKDRFSDKLTENDVTISVNRLDSTSYYKNRTGPLRITNKAFSYVNMKETKFEIEGATLFCRAILTFVAPK